mmetsp:Transcript_35203/g.53942  ORF Transcript_35203/g.53942 Transcript_35203/m.53942 type:complete len:172 (+) Transcript_35203:116-631(+)|eukprot:CAMPEP_0170511876 /NCGR_PEP_ID=MMETSP0208-20121228/66540_1 /TAXON_ID=197538 /ORGANISM="Strombidium inclinatum, Strain S3" /LENGTH=171 /DNA_ID=CAMNT_0010795449 /DNA_START=722 /DNA_END=1237 /DNA_ORIENTATION=-
MSKDNLNVPKRGRELKNKRLSKGNTTVGFKSGDLRAPGAHKKDAHIEHKESSDLSRDDVEVDAKKAKQDRKTTQPPRKSQNQPAASRQSQLAKNYDTKPEAEGLDLHVDAMGEFKKIQQEAQNYKARMVVKKVTIDKKNKFTEDSPENKSRITPKLGRGDGSEISQVRKFV